jgi:hypothetical protein
VANSEILLAVTMWLTWAIRPDPNSAEIDPPVDSQMLSVSFQRLKELGSRLAPRAQRDVNAGHQLVRFNLYNFGEQSVVVSAMALPNARGETLHCEVAPSIVVAAGARYPMIFEVLNGPIQEVAQIAVEMNGRRSWVATQSLPKS